MRVAEHLIRLQHGFQTSQLLVQTEDDAIFVRDVLHQLSLPLQLLFLDFDPTFPLLLILVFQSGNFFARCELKVCQLDL